METRLANLFADVDLLEPVNLDGFQVFGLRRREQRGLCYLTLDEALAGNLVEVTEISDGGSVPTLKVSNLGSSRLFLMSGEQLQGAKQNRVLNVSIMVDSKSEIPIPVTCVEAGRWCYESRKFSSSGTASHSSLRTMMARDITSSYRVGRDPSSNQGAVWGEIARKLAKMGSRSETSALNQVYEDYGARLKQMTDCIQLPTGCCGAVFAFAGRIAGMDMFDQSSTFARLWPKLVRSYAIDALEAPSQLRHLTRETVAGWLTGASTAKAEKFRSPGIGEDIRLEGADLVGSSLVVEDQAVHVELFTTKSKAPAPTERQNRAYF